MCYTMYIESEVQTMPKFLATGYYCEIWKLLVEADTAEEAQDIADANIFEDGIEVDGYFDKKTLEEVADDQWV